MVLGLLPLRPELAQSVLRCCIPLARSKCCGLGLKRSCVVQVSVGARTVYTTRKQKIRENSEDDIQGNRSVNTTAKNHTSVAFFFFPSFFQ